MSLPEPDEALEPDDPSGDEDHESEPAEDQPRGRFAAVTDRVDTVRKASLERFEVYEERWPPVAVARSFVHRYLDVNGVVLSGHLAFRSFSFLLPLALVAVAIAGLTTFYGGDPGATAGDSLKLGEAIRQSMHDAGSEASAAPFHVAFVALLGLVLGSLGMLSGLNYVYAQAWQVNQRKVESKFHKVWRLIAALVLLMIVLMGASALRESGFVLGTAGSLVVALTFTGATLGLGLMMPRRCEEWYWLLPGAVVGGLGFLALQAFANWYLPEHLASLSKTYGALAIAAVLLSYLFLVGQVIVSSAIASAVWYDYRTGEHA